MFGINEVWLLLSIPLLATTWLMIYHRKSVVLWELLTIWLVCIISIGVSQIIVEKISISDKEIWGYNGEQAVYDEPFQYWDTCSETYQCGEDCSTNSQGNRSCSPRYCTRYYPCERWGGNVAHLVDQMNNKHTISTEDYKRLESKQWNNSKTIELHREKTYDIIVDGDRRITRWPGTWEISEPIAEEHTYENRTIRSTAVRFQQITPEMKIKYKLFDYPKVYGRYKINSVLDQNGHQWQKANKKWNYLNGIFGPKRNLRAIVLIFRDQTREVIYMQQGHWYNGNKNEFIICIGADKDGNVTWSDVISWTEVEELKIEFRDEVPNVINKVDEESLVRLAEWAEPKLRRYIKPEFTDKFKHLSVRPSTTSMIITAVIILLITIGICVWVVKNEFQE